MVKKILKISAAVLLSAAVALQPVCEFISPAITAFAYTQREGIVNATSLNVRARASTSSDTLTKLTKGTKVTVTDEVSGDDGKIWYKVTYSGTSSGYVLSSYIRFAVSYSYDAAFENALTAQGFPESYKDGLRSLHAQYPSWVFKSFNTGLSWSDAVDNEMVLPRSLVSSDSISSYKSTEKGAYDWNTSTWTGFDGSSWVAASREILSYYMDPRNFFDDIYVFQFLNQKYDSSLQTKDGLKKLVQGTFLGSSEESSSSGNSASGTGSQSGSTSFVTADAPTLSKGPGSFDDDVSLSGPSASISKNEVTVVNASPTVTVGASPSESSGGPGGSGTAGSETSSQQSSSYTADTAIAASGNTAYIDIIMDAASQSGVNPYVLAAMILQEQGTDGHGRSISGTVSGYSGYYNFFNIGAYASGSMGAVERGLWYASQNDSYGRPWNTREKSILGGAKFYGENYVKTGQDTFYLKKYNVQGSNMYKHQYMTNVDGAAAEASFFAEGYSEELKKAALVFSIPVYSGMPDSPCSLPTGTGSPNNRLSSLEVEGYTLTPSFGGDTTEYDLVVNGNVSSVNVIASASSGSASVSGTGTVALSSSRTDVTVTVTAQNGSVKKYVIHIAKQGSSGNDGSSGASQTSSSQATSSENASPGTTSPVIVVGVSP